MTTQPNTEPLKVGEQMPTASDALEALDAMDDYARMDTGVDAIGPREVLRAFIQSHNGHAEPSPAEVKPATGEDLAIYNRIAANYQAARVEGVLTDALRYEISDIIESLRDYKLDQAQAEQAIFRAIERALNQRLAVKEGEAVRGANPFHRLLPADRPDYADNLDIRAVLYVDSINDQQTCRDDLWLATTTALKALSTHPVSDDQQAKDAALYKELLYCVGNKYPGESRHDTAKRYLLDREKFGVGEPALSTTKQEEV